jgi:hypothetical protein
MSYVCIKCGKSPAWNKAISNDSPYEPSFQWRRSEVSIIHLIIHVIIYPYYPDMGMGQ